MLINLAQTVARRDERQPLEANDDVNDTSSANCVLIASRALRSSQPDDVHAPSGMAARWRSNGACRLSG